MDIVAERERTYREWIANGRKGSWPPPHLRVSTEWGRISPTFNRMLFEEMKASLLFTKLIEK